MVVRTSCPSCGEVDVPIEDLFLSVISETEGGYGFRCPECQEGVWKEDADGRVIKLLIIAGVEDIQTIAAAF